MNRKRLSALVATIGFLASTATAAPQAPVTATRIIELPRQGSANITQDLCLARAEFAITAGIGFRLVAQTPQSRAGAAPGYTAVVRCIVNRGVIVMTVSGPSARFANDGVQLLLYSFEGVR